MPRATRKLKPCKEGKIRNPKTNRCISASTNTTVKRRRKINTHPPLVFTVANMNLIRYFFYINPAYTDVMPQTLPHTFYLNMNLIVYLTLYKYMTTYIKNIQNGELSTIKVIGSITGNTGKLYKLMLQHLGEQFAYYFDNKRQHKLFVYFTPDEIKTLIHFYDPKNKYITMRLAFENTDEDKDTYLDEMDLLQHFNIIITSLLMEVVDVLNMKDTLSFAEIAKDDAEIDAWFSNIGYKEIQTDAEFNAYVKQKKIS